MDSSSRLTGLLFATAVFACGQSVHPVANMFDPKATPADSVFNVSMLMLAICAAIFLVVGGTLSVRSDLLGAMQHGLNGATENALIFDIIGVVCLLAGWGLRR